jgi:hypothetical protein
MPLAPAWCCVFERSDTVDLQAAMAAPLRAITDSTFGIKLGDTGASSMAEGRIRMEIPGMKWRTADESRARP